MNRKEPVMTLASEIMGKLQTAMNEVDRTLGPIEPGSSVRPFVQIAHKEEPVAQEQELRHPDHDLAPGSLVDWLRLLHAQHKHTLAKMDTLDSRFTAEREHLLTQVTEQQNAILARLDEIAKFVGL